jgi:transcriptional regulator with XRE-family HTH domain
MALKIHMRNFNLISSEGVCAVLGDRVRTLRLAKNITKQELASMTQSSLSSIHRAEAGGHMTLDLFVRIAQSLHAIDALEGLLVQNFQSIADLENQEQQLKRKRARSKKIAFKPRNEAEER